MSELDRRLREASDAVATMDPPADLWARVIERAGAGDAVLHDRTDVRRRSWPTLWLAVAAVTVLLALVAGALALVADERNDDTVDTVDDPTVDTTPTTEAPPQGAAPGTIVSGAGCPFGITGDPIAMTPGPVDPLSPRFDGEPGQGIAHSILGEQVIEVRVPGFVLTDESGWHIEDIELGRGPARLWLDGPVSGERNLPFVQVIFNPDGEEPCSSFTVTVDGGTEGANRQIAVDIAERLVLPSELADFDLPGAEGGPVAGLELAGSEWRVAVNAPPSESLTVSFTETTVTWDNGCATVTADYVLDRAEGVLTLSNPTSTSPGCTPPTVQGGFHPAREIDAVMAMERIPATYVFGFPGGDPAELEPTVLYLGDYPMGTHVALTPA